MSKKNGIMEYKEFVSTIQVIVDTDEKKNYWITDYLTNNSIAFEKRKMKSGDYGFMLFGEPQKIIIERKNSLSELSGNLASKEKKDLFYAEFDRVPKVEKYLIVESDCLDNLLSGTYGGKYNKNSYIANLLLLCKRFNIQLHFINKYNFAEFMLKIFYYYYYNLKKNELIN